MCLDSTFQELAGVRYWNEYGVDEEAPFPKNTTSNIVEIPESWLTLCNLHKVSRDSVFHLQELTANISPLLDDVKEGINVYKEALKEIENVIEDPCCNVS